MKGFLMIAIFMAGTSTAFSQIVVDGKDIGEMNIKYIEIVAMAKFMSNKITIGVDYGQKVKFGGQKLQAQDGKALIFETVVHALNFMDKNGWEYVNNYAVSTGSQHVYHYLFKKKE